MSQSESEQPQKERLPHSIWGILSFAFALLAVAANCLTFVPVEYREILNELIPHNWGQGGDPDPLLPTGTLIAGFLVLCLLLGSILLAFLAFVLGIVSVCQPHTRKVFAIWGLVLSLLPFVLVALAIICDW